MTHVVAGFPGRKESQKIVLMMDSVGADVIEMQIPFSDPVADGPTMMKCNELSLKRGFRVSQAFEMMKEMKDEVSAKLLFMTYFNIVFTHGIEDFCREAKQAGASGLIVPDMPVEEEKYNHFLELCAQYELDWIPVVSPITPQERIAQMSSYAGGFWYVVSRLGVTGASDTFSHSTQQQIKYIQKYSSLPISLAFGVSKKQHVQKIGSLVDMAVIGSAVQNIFLQEENDFEQNLREAELFLLSLR